jgi:hypothetical protein
MRRQRRIGERERRILSKAERIFVRMQRLTHPRLIAVFTFQSP